MARNECKQQDGQTDGRAEQQLNHSTVQEKLDKVGAVLIEHNGTYIDRNGLVSSSDSSGGQQLDKTTVQEKLDELGLVLIEDGKYVDWDSSNPRHPRNWSLWVKCYNVALISWLEAFQTAISTSGTTASDEAIVEYGISKVLGYFAFMTLYLIGQTVGSIVCPPISETFGRRTLYIVSAAVYCAFCAVIAAVPSVIAIFFGRFITGFASAIPATVAFGNFDDMHDAETRIWIVYLYTTCGNSGLVLGPIYASYIAQALGWRWIFYIATIVTGISAIGIFFLRESRSTILLRPLVHELETATQVSFRLRTEDERFAWGDFVQTSIYRPLFFLVTEPLVFFCAVLCTIAFALIYAQTESLTIVYETFGFTTAETSLAFIPLLIGLLLNVFARLYDQKLFDRCRKQDRPILPETKIHSFAVACPALAVGLWIFAWTVPPMVHEVHWIVSMLGLVLIGFATNDFAVVLFGYITDSYTTYAASAVSSLSLSRTIAAAVFPLFTTQMYEGLGANVATSIIAGVATLFAFTPFLFFRYGRRLREKSKYARGST